MLIVVFAAEKSIRSCHGWDMFQTGAFACPNVMLPVEALEPGDMAYTSGLEAPTAESVTSGKTVFSSVPTA